MNLQLILNYLPVVIAPVVLIIFSLISAYVFKFGLKHTGINTDYILFSIFVVIALVLGGAI